MKQNREWNESEALRLIQCAERCALGRGANRRIDRLERELSLAERWGWQSGAEKLSAILERRTEWHEINASDAASRLAERAINCVNMIVGFCEEDGTADDETPYLAVLHYDSEEIVSMAQQFVNDWAKETNFLYDEYTWGVVWLYSDEWDTCEYCHRMFNTQPQSYRWTPGYIDLPGVGYVCKHCVMEDEVIAQDYVNNLVQRRMRKNPPIDVVLEEDQIEALGYVLLDLDLETGYHEHQNDDPTVLARKLNPITQDFFFVLISKGQFDIAWTVAVRQEDLSKITEAKFENESFSGFSISRAAKAALKELKELKPGLTTVELDDEFANGYRTTHE